MTRDEANAFGDLELVAVAPTLLATARYLARSDADAADLVQATLEIAVLRRGQLRDPDRLRPWLLAILTREAFRLRRRLRALVSLEGSVIEVAVAGTSDDDLAVRAAIAQLPTRMRAAVVLHHRPVYRFRKPPRPWESATTRSRRCCAWASHASGRRWHDVPDQPADADQRRAGGAPAWHVRAGGSAGRG
jgi:hypothetical protein